MQLSYMRRVMINYLKAMGHTTHLRGVANVLRLLMSPNKIETVVNGRHCCWGM